MSLKKQFLKSKDVCKVTFRLGKNESQGAERVFLVGEFSGGDHGALEMTRLKYGDFKATVELEPDRGYQFRYLLDGKQWRNDSDADAYVPSGVSTEENSVVRV